MFIFQCCIFSVGCNGFNFWFLDNPTLSPDDGDFNETPPKGDFPLETEEIPGGAHFLLSVPEAGLLIQELIVLDDLRLGTTDTLFFGGTGVFCFDFTGDFCFTAVVFCFDFGVVGFFFFFFF